MYYSFLMVLKEILNEEQCDSLGDYFCGLTPNTKDLITVSKIAKLLGVDSKVALSVLLECERIGYLSRQYGIRCPECGALIKMMSVEEYENDLFEKVAGCYGCDEYFSFSVSDDDIVVYFKLEIDVGPFAVGRQEQIKNEMKSPAFVAREDTMSFFIEVVGDSLKTIAKNQDHEYQYRLEMERKAEEDKILEEKAVKKYKINKWVSFVIGFIGYLLLAFGIVWVYKQYGFAKISIVATFGSTFISFIFNYIVYLLLPKDIDFIKRLLKQKKSK